MRWWAKSTSSRSRRGTEYLTDHFDHRGFTRARYLSSGDLLLCGPVEAPAEDGSDERRASELFFLPRGGEHPAQPLGEPCFEGPAVSRSWGYDEAEGVFPDGRSIAVEREPGTFTALPVGDLDIWRLPLDGSGRATRLTRFSEYAGYGANNPVIGPDGSKMAFGLRIKGGEHGNARGVLLYDFEKAPHDVEEAPGSQEEVP